MPVDLPIPPIPPSLLQMGAFGLLVLVLIWHGRIISKIVERALAAFDKVVISLSAIEKSLYGIEVRLEQVEDELGIDKHRRRPSREE